MNAPSDLVQLPVVERLKCMEVLWDSLRSEQPGSPAWHGRVLGARQAKIDSGEAKMISGDELKRRLRR